MKKRIDLSADAVTKRLRQVEDLRLACLCLADGSAGRDVRQRFQGNESVRRTSRALGHGQGRIEEGSRDGN